MAKPDSSDERIDLLEGILQDRNFTLGKEYEIENPPWPMQCCARYIYSGDSIVATYIKTNRRVEVFDTQNPDTLSALKEAFDEYRDLLNHGKDIRQRTGEITVKNSIYNGALRKQKKTGLLAMIFS